MIPAGIGIPGGQPVTQPGSGPFVGSGQCLYWLHTHDQTSVIHIESPVHRTYTLGDFFDIWGQPLTSRHADPATGTLTTYLNGHPYHGNPRAIPLQPHTVIQLDIGTNTPPRPCTFPPGL